MVNCVAAGGVDCEPGVVNCAVGRWQWFSARAHHELLINWIVVICDPVLERVVVDRSDVPRCDVQLLWRRELPRRRWIGDSVNENHTAKCGNDTGTLRKSIILPTLG